MGLDWQRLAPAGTRKQMVATALAGLLLGLGGVTAGTSLVQASERSGLLDFFESIFRGPEPERVAPVRRPARYTALPDPRQASVPRLVRHTPRGSDPVVLDRRPKAKRGTGAVAEIPGAAPARLLAVALGTRTVCVRACDGYVFPLGRLGAAADLPVHQAACAAACPNTPTRVYTLGRGETELDRAVALDGRPYRTLAVANLYRAKRIAQCSCQPEGVAAAPLPIDQDRTARAGDVVATVASAGIVTPVRGGGLTVVDFRTARGLSRRARRDIDAKVDVIRREADAQAFRRTLRSAERGQRIRLAAGPEFQPALPPIEVEPSFGSKRARAAPRVVMASPFVY